MRISEKDVLKGQEGSHSRCLPVSMSCGECSFQDASEGFFLQSLGLYSDEKLQKLSTLKQLFP